MNRRKAIMHSPFLPWYRTYWAYGFYALVFFVYGLFVLQEADKSLHSSRYSMKKNRTPAIQLAHQLELEKTERKS